jgi:LysM repeat protein
MVMQQLFGGMNPAAGAYGQGNAGLGGGIGFVPQANLPVGQLKAPTPVEGAKSADLLNKATDVLTLADKASTAWKDFVPGKSPVDPNAFDIANRDPNNTGTMAAGGAAYARGGLAAGGLPYDPQNSGYVPDNSPQKMPELQQPNNPDGSGQSGLSKLTDMAKFAMMFIPKADGGSVDVVKGDTMSKIAREHGLSLADLEKANPDIRNYDRISIGQHINLPQLAQAAGTPTSGYDPALAQPAGTPTAGYNPSPGLIPAAGIADRRL